MHTKLSVLVLALVLAMPANAQEQGAVHKVITDFFEIFSTREVDKLSNVCTDDILIVEDGELWNRDSIAKFLAKPAPPDFRRENTMKFIDTNIKGQTAWTTYENTARILANQRKFIVVWYETAVLVNENKRWRIRTLHSTTKENRRQ